jgi:hypothetical protein
MPTNQTPTLTSVEDLKLWNASGVLRSKKHANPQTTMVLLAATMNQPQIVERLMLVRPAEF